MLPQFPPWDGLHPLVVHFPIALLLVAPLFIVMSVFFLRDRRPYATAALALLVVGVGALGVAWLTGHGAGEIAKHSTIFGAAIERHEVLAQTTLAVFLALTAVWALIVFAGRLIAQHRLRASFGVLSAIFLVFYAAGAILLVKTAHEGAMLVHRDGIRARVAATAGAPSLVGIPVDRAYGEERDDD